ncbi:MAG TPA: PQQ-binding-like beta-propeller repeat protein [Capsulimonadaceae bacterium]|nr:PQQ-binding-like beta-propeller repeat protein [Capsulimonadaceae bacterium]
MKRVLPFALLALVLFGAIYLWGRDPRPSSTPASQKSASAAALGPNAIDLDKVAAVDLPKPNADLKPMAFKTPDGKQGWVVRFPGASSLVASLPLSTPAYDKGKLYLGGGFGSSKFYSLDAQTGNLVWQAPTADDGPTSPSVDHNNVAINTQSCSLMVMDKNNGQTRWKEWLGDPLVSQPTISKGRVYASSPNNAGYTATMAGLPGGSTALSMIESPSATFSQQHPITGYSMLCADVMRGHHLWKQSIPQEVISAPIVVGDRMYFSCYDGTVECLNAVNGSTIWHRELNATSAPVVAHDRVIVTVRVDRQEGPYEGVLRLDAATGRSLDRQALALTPAGYLATSSGGCVALDAATQHSLDSSAGFPDGLPSPTVEVGSVDDFGINTLTGAWTYQGSRVAVGSRKIFDAQGAYINGLRETDGAKLWRMQVVGQGVSPDMQIFSPPALGARDLYICSGLGVLLSLSQADGHVQFAYKLGVPVAYQPILAGGNIYIATANGLLICIKTGKNDAAGWTAWGGNSLHNKAG